MRNEKEVLELFEKWAEDNNNVRTAILTSSRTRENCNIDFLSDYDIELYVSSVETFLESDEWLNHFGNIMVRWPYKPRSTGDDNWITRLVLFDDGLRIDFQITALKEINNNRYINGYKILIDKDSMTKDMIPPTYDEFIIRKPSKEEFENAVNEFWWDVYYVPKYLYRDQLPFAKYMLDNIIRFEYLHKIIDWYIGYHNNWLIETGLFGKKYKKLLSEDDWNEYLTTFTGSDIQDNWNALLNMVSMFRRLSKTLSEELGYNYPENVDNDVMDFCHQIMNNDKNTEYD